MVFKSIFTAWGFFLILLPLAAQDSAQSKSLKELAEEKVDTNYIAVYPNLLTTRLYFSRKFTDLDIIDNPSKVDLDYEPNTSLNFGVGFTLRGFTLNLAYGFNFLNPDVGKGETRYLDLQSHLYGRKFVIDFLGQFYGGQYLNNTQFHSQNFPEPHYLRPDLKIRLFGLSIMRVTNGRKFSYAAPFVQNEYQKKSSGSFLYGLKAFYQLSFSDSSMIPSFVDPLLFQDIQGLRQFESFQLGPAAGYAHSFVMKKHFFISLSADIALMASKVNYKRLDLPEVSQWQVNPSFFFKGAMGYNSDTWYLGLMAVNETTTNKSKNGKENIQFGVGNIRINYVKRFDMGPKLIKQIDRLPLIGKPNKN